MSIVSIMSSPLLLEELRKMQSKIELTSATQNKLSSDKDTKDALRAAYLSNKLAIVLGAGVSIDYGLPSWNTLLQALLAQTFQVNGDSRDKSLLIAEVFNGTFEPSPLIAARYLSGHFSKLLEFEKEIQKLLYQHIKTEYSTDLMKELVQLVAAPGKSPTLDSIITYNYDDVLENEVLNSSIDVPFRSIFSTGVNPKDNELPIYHVHGFIPRKGKLTSSNQITLGEDLYHKQYTDIYSWANLVQLTKYKNNNCLFIGTSFTDPNQRRLLDIANTQRGDNPPKHYIIRKRYDISKIEESLKKFINSNEDVTNSKEKQNIKFSDLAQEMIEIIHRFDENDAYSLGVQSIWVDEHDEIPNILKNMRKIA
jgi:hypothetical protein